MRHGNEMARGQVVILQHLSYAERNILYLCRREMRTRKRAWRPSHEEKLIMLMHEGGSYHEKVALVEGESIGIAFCCIFFVLRIAIVAIRPSILAYIERWGAAFAVARSAMMCNGQ